MSHRKLWGSITVGDRFGRLVVKELRGGTPRDAREGVVATCICDCGEELEVHSVRLRMKKHPVRQCTRPHPCPHCGVMFKPAGESSHRQKCVKRLLTARAA